jgi:hypothetical protein
MKSVMTNSFVFAVSAIASLTALRSAPAEAAYIRHASNVCVPIDASNQYYQPGWLANPNMDAESRMVCPIRSDNRHPHGSMTSLHAYVDDRNTFSLEGGKIRVSACVAYSLSFGGVCGSTAATSGSGTGFSDLTVSRSRLTEFPGEYPYLLVIFPARQFAENQDGYSKLFGFTSTY